MTPENVLNAVYEQLRPLVIELARYNDSSDDSVLMEYDIGTVRFEFKKKDEDNN